MLSFLAALFLNHAQQEAPRAPDTLDLLAAQDAPERILAVLHGQEDDFDETV